jgi:hypothetical protein
MNLEKNGYELDGFENEPIDAWRYHWVDSFMEIFGFTRLEKNEKEGDKMKEVAIEDLIINTILNFCENAAELGCPRDKEVDMWFRELSYGDAYKVAEKILEIEERDTKRFHNEENRDAEEKDEETEEMPDKIIIMHEIELDLDEKTIDGLCKYALEEIKNDKEALINYAANKAFRKIVETDGKCLGNSQNDLTNE